VLDHNGEPINHRPQLICIFHFLYRLVNFGIRLSTEISKSIITANSQSKITTEKGPVMLLYELFTDISFSCTQTIGPQHAKFKTQVTVNGVEFEGTGEDELGGLWVALINRRRFIQRSVEEAVEECSGKGGTRLALRHLLQSAQPEGVDAVQRDGDGFQRRRQQWR
jgi:hypothetical protein